MVTRFECDKCGETVGYEDNNALVQNKIKSADLCNDCAADCKDWIRDNESEPKEKIDLHPLDVAEATKLLKNEGYILYKKPAVWGQKEKTKEKVKAKAKK